METGRVKRPVRNNNPLNLKVQNLKDPWLGMIELDEEGHAVFDSKTPVMGFRAGILNMINAAKRSPLTTVRDHIKYFAAGASPESLKNYMDLLAQYGINADTRMGFMDPVALTKAMAVFESGRTTMPDDPLWEEAVNLLVEEGHLPIIKKELGPKRQAMKERKQVPGKF